MKYGDDPITSINWSAMTAPAKSIVAVMSVITIGVVGINLNFLWGSFSSVM